MEDDQVLDAIKKLDAHRLHEEPHEENTMKYPKEIYKDINGKEMTNPERLWGEGMGRRHAYDLGHEAGYAKCLADRSDPLSGYSNLTEAIKAGEPIDYEKLDGLKVQCVKSGVGTLYGTLKRDDEVAAEHCEAWWNGLMDESYTTALWSGWNDKHGWTLYVEGEIPLRRKTADQLKLGTYFLGQLKGESPYLAYVGRPLATDTEKTIYYAPEMLKSITPASEWVVLEEYGPFQKPEDK